MPAPPILPDNAAEDALTTGPIPVARFIKEIGRGADGARALVKHDARALFTAMLEGRVADVQLGAILMAYRIKGETPEELDGMLEATHAHCLPLPAPDIRVVPEPVLPVVIPSYNGARRQPNLVPLLAKLLAREGVPVLVHGIRHFDGRITTATLFEALGWPICEHMDEARERLENERLAYVPIDVLSPDLTALLDKREIVGLRNSAHTVVKMLQPIGGHAPHEALRLVSYTHPEYRDTLTDYFLRHPANVLLARGTEGEAVADARRGSAVEWLHDGTHETVIEAVEGSSDTPPELPAGMDAAATARWIEAVLDGKQPVPEPIAKQVRAIVRCARPTRPA
ncbi:DNA-binding protein YbiB [Ralstonia sp. UBA689]|uniref:DNA-binding protein YbiB n=1 Tax=Ralstonia sp. UBA689 TaxID=1947373 RepID=UPI0025D4E693|nr:DNA-binding protein YbiB [Ralstonia sp. UBA689]